MWSSPTSKLNSVSYGTGDELYCIWSMNSIIRSGLWIVIDNKEFILQTIKKSQSFTTFLYITCGREIRTEFFINCKYYRTNPTIFPPTLFKVSVSLREIVFANSVGDWRKFTKCLILSMIFHQLSTP